MVQCFGNVRDFVQLKQKVKDINTTNLKIRNFCCKSANIRKV